MKTELSTLQQKVSELYKINYLAKDDDIRATVQSDYKISAMENFIKPILASSAPAVLKQLAYVFYSILEDKLALIWVHQFYNKLGVLHGLVDFPGIEKFKTYKDLEHEIGDYGDYEGSGTDSSIHNLYWCACKNFDFIRGL